MGSNKEITKNKVKDSGDALEDDFALSEVEEDNVEAIYDSEEEEVVGKKKKNRTETIEGVPVKAKKSKVDRETNVLELSKIELVDYFWTKLRSSYPEKSIIELENFKVEDESFIDNDAFDEPHVIGNFGQYITKHIKDPESLSISTSRKGAPLVLVLTPSAIRATSVVRELRDLSGKLPVGKLFAKHIKIPEQKKFLESFSFTLGVGTPNRITKLIEMGYLDLSRLELVVIDLFKDAKNRNLFNIPECGKDFFDFHCASLSTLIKDNNVKVAFF
ncbi:hypothetical protein K502DRAFT_346635 [Neoconidiobolus thromboides FSU 785]|nr:hypothetical protein K502DRAFT_346635 [Neoconidiobolus thromboides FSU 785]